MKSNHCLIIFILILAGTESSAEHSYPNDRSDAIKENDGLTRNIRIHPDIVIVKRNDPGLAKNRESTWTNTLEKSGALSVDPLFLQHQTNGSRLSSIFKIQLFQGKDVFQAVETLSLDPSVEWAEPVYEQALCYDPDDVHIGSQWYLDQIQARRAWDQFKGDTTVVMGIVDTGVNLTHPDLSANIWKNPGETVGDGIDNDGNQFVDDVHGWDFGAYDNDPNPSESITITDLLRWHGTGVSGVAGAVTDNGIGMAAPAFNAKIMAVKVMNEDGIIWSHISATGIVYAIDNGADIINASFGGPASNVTLEAVNYADEHDVLIIAAAGNDNSDSPIYPAGYPSVISVAASDQNDERAIFGFAQGSNYGYTVDVTAPGIHMVTTWNQNGYTYASGTSLSTPLTASVAALLKGHHPEWDADQIGEQIRVSSDPIDDLNPSFEKKLGYGRINADRALMLSSPAIQFTEVTLVEGSNAKNDSIFDPGEEILVTFKVKNFLEPTSGIQLDLKTDNSDVILQDNSFFLSSLGTLEEWNNNGNPLKIKIDPHAPRGQKVDVLLNISSSGAYEDYDYFDFFISPTYATIQGARVQLTLSSNGKLGFIDYPNNEEGEGFTFDNRGNLLFEGAVMAATAPDSVSDVARGLNSNAQNDDFYADVDGEIEIHRPGDLSDQQGEAVFTDQNSPGALHLKIFQTTMAFDDSLDGEYILLRYHIENISTEPRQGLYFGLFLDWDVDNLYDNVPGYDADLCMGYIYDPTTSIFGACQVVSETLPVSYHSILNEDEIYPEAGGYSDAEKWAHLSGGIQPITHTDHGDYSHVLGVGPIDLSPGDSTVVGFALLGGEELDALIASGSHAREKWRTLFGTAAANDEDIAIRPSRPELGHNYPNPFNASTKIRYTISEKNHIILTIHNLLGQEVARLVDAIQEPDQYETEWNGETAQEKAASGVYFYKLKAGSFEQVRKMVLIQ
ncbi:S8 family serine peptidase [bacterium]|nr:S8 family serine peptidase [bacterium]